MHPVAPPVCDRPGTPDEKTGINKETEVVIVAYRDMASGVMLELVSLNMTSLMNRMAVSVVQTITSLQYPIFVHANINVSNYSDGMKAYNVLGYTEIAKHFGYGQNNLYKALEIPDPGIAKEVTLIKTKNEALFAIDLIEWEEKSKSSGGITTDRDPIRIGFTVKDIPNEIDRITSTNSVTAIATAATTSATDATTEPYWTLVDNPKIVEYPAPLDKAIVATVRDKDGMEVDLVEYPVTLTQQLNVPTTNKIILLTGCDSGFGRSLSCRLSLLGFDVVAACYTEEGAKFLDRIVTKTVVADLGTSDGVQSVVDACRDVLNQNYKRLWAIVNNAGVCFPGNVDWQNPNIYKKSMDVNFHAPVKIIHELLQELKAVQGSRIMQTSSVCGLLAQPTNSAYCSTKHALEACSDSSRCELYPYDCHVTIVQPALMKTKLALTYWDTWYKGFKLAREDRRKAFDSDKIDKFIDESRQRLHDAAEDSDVTTLAMVKALLEPNPPTRLRTGIGAELFFRPVSMLSDTMRDSILWKIMDFDSVHTKI
jgi:retinol dehydrogenase-16